MEWPTSASIRSCGRFTSSSTRTCQQALARELKGCDGLFASNGRKLPEKLVQRVATLDVVEQRLDRDPGAHEHGRSAQNLRVAVYDERFAGYDHPSIAPAGITRRWSPIARSPTGAPRSAASRRRSALTTAVHHADEACRLDPSSGEAWAALGLVSHQARDPERAVAAARRATALEPDNWRHHLRLAYVSWSEERLRTAH